MSVPSFKLCNRLHQLSGWERADLWAVDQDTNKGTYRYDLSYLLNKLPKYLHDGDEQNRLFLYLGTDIKGKWNASYETEGRYYFPTTSDTPEDVVCKLAIKLLKEGVIQK